MTVRVIGAASDNQVPRAAVRRCEPHTALAQPCTRTARRAIERELQYACWGLRCFAPAAKRGSLVQVEAHILHKYAGDFYGEELKLLVVGFLRPEMQFSGLDDLINRIHTDIGLAQNQLAQQDAREVAPEGWWA